MPYIVILNDTNAPINSAISCAGTKHSWVNAMAPKEYYVHNAAPGLFFTLQERWWAGEQTEFKSNAGEIVGFILSAIGTVVGVILTATGIGAAAGVPLLSAAGATVIAGTVTTTSSVALLAVDAAFLGSEHVETEWTNISSNQERKFILRGRLDFEEREVEGKDGKKYKTTFYKPDPENPLTLTELQDSEFQHLIKTEFKEYQRPADA